MSGPRRRELIPAIREGLARSVPATLEAVNQAIDAWRDGAEPAHPLEAGIFAMCDQVATDLDARDAGEPDAPAADGCSNPDGHDWDRTPGEADEARIRGDHANDSIRCIYCGADGDA